MGSVSRVGWLAGLVLGACYQAQRPAAGNVDAPPHPGSDADAGSDAGIDADSGVTMSGCMPVFVEGTGAIGIVASRLAFPATDHSYMVIANSLSLSVVTPVPDGPAGALYSGVDLDRPMVSPDGAWIYVVQDGQVMFASAGPSFGTLKPATGLPTTPGAAGSPAGTLLHAFVPDGNGVSFTEMVETDEAKGLWDVVASSAVAGAGNDVIESFNLTSSGLSATYAVASSDDQNGIGTWFARRDSIDDPFVLDPDHISQIVTIPLLDATLSADCTQLIGIDDGGNVEYFTAPPL